MVNFENLLVTLPVKIRPFGQPSVQLRTSFGFCGRLQLFVKVAQIDIYIYIYTNAGEANLIHNTICYYKFDAFFDMISHFGDTIWSDWARLWLACGPPGRFGAGGRAQNSLHYICIPYLPPLSLISLLARL